MGATNTIHAKSNSNQRLYTISDYDLCGDNLASVTTKAITVHKHVAFQTMHMTCIEQVSQKGTNIDFNQ